MLPDAAAVARTLADAGVTAECATSALGLACVVDRRDVGPALRALVAEGDFAMLVDLVGTDTGEGIELTYHVRSFTRDEEVYLRTLVGYLDRVVSVWDIYPGAIYTERETAELLGVVFEGHPNLKRLFTTDDVEGFLLRKEVPIRGHEDVVRPGVRSRERPEEAKAATDG